MKRVAVALGLRGDAGLSEILAAIQNLRAGPSRDDVLPTVDRAIALGRLSRRMRSWAVDYARQSPRSFRQFISHAPEQPVLTAAQELVSIANERVKASAGSIDLARALNDAAKQFPDLAQQVQEERGVGGVR